MQLDSFQQSLHIILARGLDNVTAHSESGKKLLRSGQMSFLCCLESKIETCVDWELGSYSQIAFDKLPGSGG